MLKLLLYLGLLASLATLVILRWERIKLGLKIVVAIWVGLAAISVIRTGLDERQIQALLLIGAAGAGVYGVGRLVERLARKGDVG